jgi:hypothetical protein
MSVSPIGQQTASERCNGPECGKPLSLSQVMRCGACRRAIYCGQKCQLGAWPSHQG